MIDLLVVGAGLYGAVFAQQAKAAGKRVLVIDRRDHIAGNAYTEDTDGIKVHKYGAHIFHTNDKEVWNYVQKFAEFNRFTNAPMANYHGELYSLPFNMLTFNKMWGVATPAEAAEKIIALMSDPERNRSIRTAAYKTAKDKLMSLEKRFGMEVQLVEDVAMGRDTSRYPSVL